VKKRWWIIGWIVVGLLVVAAVLFLVFRNTTTVLSAADLGFTGTVGDAPGEPGIYLYDTTGYDEIDALGGARHDYPDLTYGVITESECGPVVRWYAVAERWLEWQHCGPDFGITATTNFHEWFHVPDTGRTTCAEPVFPPDGQTTWTTVCDDGETITTDVATFVGMETLVIDGRPVETVHVRIDSTATGVSVATTTTDEWRLPGTALVVRKQYDDDSVNDTRIGTVHFVEHVVIQLRSLVPTG